MSELRIERIDVLSKDQLVVSRVTLLDAKGRPVLDLRGLRARLDAWTLIKNALFQPTTRIELPRVTVERLEIGVYRTESGGVSLTEAFDTRASPGKSESPSTGGKSPRIQLPQVAIDCVSARTDLSGLSQATAELHAARVNFDWSPELFSLGVTTEDARVLRALHLDAKARLNAQLRLPGSTDATLDGTLGNLPIHASLRASADGLTLRVSSPSLDPAAMRELVPGWPLQLPLSGNVELSGPVSAMRARVELQAGASRLDAAGPVALSPKLEGDLVVTGRALDAQLFAGNLAHTQLSVDAQLEFSLEPAIHVAFRGRSPKGELFGAPLPETALVALLADDEVTGTVASVDPALPVSVDFRVTREGALGVHARARDLALVALAPYGLRAQGRLDFDANADLVRDQLTAQFDARLRSLRIAPVLAQTASVRGKLRGPVSRPEQLSVDLEAEGANLSLGAVSFPAWIAQSKGSLARQALSVRAGPETAPTLEGATTLAFGDGLSLSETRLGARLNGVNHELALKSAHIAASALELVGLQWQIDKGSIQGSAQLGPSRKRAEFQLNGLDAQAILRSLGINEGALQGQLDGSLDFEEAGQQRRGQLTARLADGSVPEIGAVHGQFAASLAGSAVEGQGTLVVPQLGEGKLSLRSDLGHEPLSVQSLARAWGELRLDLTDIQLGEVSRRWLPAESIAFAGVVDASIRLTKPDARAPA
ncbi:MAG TPA: hypothetical protein VER04_26560, partial [Polyangiaceae bacterium]|nr:hypothetical protein [Polyangiaceae bacterium]